MNKALLSSKNMEWETPDWLFAQLDNEFHFTLDPASTHQNAKCQTHFTIEENGLVQDWTGHTVFLNPPYGRAIGQWVEKAYMESRKPDTVIVILIPARTDTAYFHEYILGKSEIRFIRGRLKFFCPQYEKLNSAPFPSMIVVYR